MLWWNFKELLLIADDLLVTVLLDVHVLQFVLHHGGRGLRSAEIGHRLVCCYDVLLCMVQVEAQSFFRKYNYALILVLDGKIGAGAPRCIFGVQFRILV